MGGGGGHGKSEQKSSNESFNWANSQSTNQSQNTAMNQSFATGTPQMALDAITSQLAGAQGVSSGYGGMLESALKGQGSAGNIPIIQQAVERSKQAASQSLAGTSDDLARSGLAGTPFGQAIMAQTQQQGNQAAARTETDMLSQLIAQVPAFLAQNATTINALTGIQGPSGSIGRAQGTSSGQSTSAAQGWGQGAGSGQSKNMNMSGGVGGGGKSS